MNLVFIRKIIAFTALTGIFAQTNGMARNVPRGLGKLAKHAVTLRPPARHLNAGKIRFNANTIARSALHLNQPLQPSMLEHALANFTTTDALTLVETIRENPSAEKLFINKALKHFTTTNPWVLQEIIDVNPTYAAQQFTPAAIAHFGSTNSNLLYKILKNNPDALPAFTTAAIAHLPTIENHHLIATILQDNPGAIDDVTDAALKNFDSIDIDVLQTIAAFNPDAADDFLQALDQELFDMIHSKQVSQSLNHIRNNKNSVLQQLLKYKQHIPLFKKILHKEQELINQGFAVFYHGGESKYFLPAILNTALYSKQTNTAAENFLLLHTQENAFDLSAQEMEKQQQLRVELLHGKYDRNYMFFTNLALFGNSKHPRSSSVHYCLQNSNASSRFSKNFTDIIKRYGLGKYVQEFAPKLNALQNQVDRNSIKEMGILHLLAIPKNKVSNMVIPVQPGGILRQVTVNNAATSDMKTIITALENNEYQLPDDLECTILMTTDPEGGLNPQSGLQVFTFMSPQLEASKGQFCNIVGEMMSEAQ